MKYQKANVSPANLICIIECLSDSEMKTGIGRKEMILDKFIANGGTLYTEHKNSIKYQSCKNTAEFTDAFKNILSLCQHGGVPHIYIDAHGDPEKGILLPSKEYISWEAQLSFFKDLITITKGELTVFALFCHSMSIVARLTRGKLPFSFYYGYNDEVTVKMIEIESTILFESLLNPSDDFTKKINQLRIACYSEYDNVKDIISYLYFIRNNPSFLSKEIPIFSKSKIFSEVEKALANDGIPLSGMRKSLNKIIHSRYIVEGILGEYMHNTTRLNMLVESFMNGEDSSKT